MYKNYNSPKDILSMKLKKFLKFYRLAKEKEEDKIIYDLWLLHLQNSDNKKSLNEFKKSVYEDNSQKENGVYIDQVGF